MKVELKGKNITVLGLGIRTGVSLVRYLCSQGASVHVYDRREEGALQNELAALHGCSFQLEAGSDAPQGLTGTDLILLSPGIQIDSPFLEDPRKKGVPIWSEIELAGRLIKAPILAITGTNGKSTTTSLLAHILESWGKKVFAGGNLGNPLINATKDSYDYVVAEISSFQLEAVEEFQPEVAVLLNISPNHLDRHRDMQTYIACKEKLFSRMGKTNRAFLNADDEVCHQIGPHLNCETHPFSAMGDPEAHAWIKENNVVLPSGETVSLSGLKLHGNHNRENALAAILVARSLGCSISVMESALSTFNPLPHRLQEVGRLGQVRFVNDSKSTTPLSTLRALESFAQPILWMAGGKSKVNSFEHLGPKAKEHVKHAFFFGECASMMEKDLSSSIPVSVFSTMEEAFRAAIQKAGNHDVVLLSPANASFDQFKNFEERGEVFARFVERETVR